MKMSDQPFDDKMEQAFADFWTENEDLMHTETLLRDRMRVAFCQGFATGYSHAGADWDAALSKTVRRVREGGGDA